MGAASWVRTRLPERSTGITRRYSSKSLSGGLNSGRLMPGITESRQRIGGGQRLHGATKATQSQAHPGTQLECEMERRGRNRRSSALRDRARARCESVLGTRTCVVAMHPYGAHSHPAEAIGEAAGTCAAQRRRKPTGHNCREQSEECQAGDKLSHYRALIPWTVSPVKG